MPAPFTFHIAEDASGNVRCRIELPVDAPASDIGEATALVATIARREGGTVWGPADAAVPPPVSTDAPGGYQEITAAEAFGATENDWEWSYKSTVSERSEWMNATEDWSDWGHVRTQMEDGRYRFRRRLQEPTARERFEEHLNKVVTGDVRRALEVLQDQIDELRGAP